MSFFGFGRLTGGDKRKANKQPQHPAGGYGYQHAQGSTLKLHRPVPHPVNPSTPSHHNLASQQWIAKPHTTVNPPQPHQQAYGQQDPAIPPRAGHPTPAEYAPWKSTGTLVGAVPTSSQVNPSRPTLRLPGSFIGHMNAASASVTNLSNILNDRMDSFLDTSLYNWMSVKLDTVISCMDEEKFSGDPRELDLPATIMQFPIHRSSQKNLEVTESARTNHFAKVWQYSNSRLPPNLPPVTMYLNTWPLLNTAARYSLSVYSKAKGLEKADRVKISFTNGTKSVVLKSMPIENMNVIVFAIRGTATFMDWAAVNMRRKPTSPVGFFDDADNYCHDGFLECAKAMVKPVAERLRVLLQEDPSRGQASLLITGHSAGGAIAQLLYAHMTSVTVRSELTFLVDFFKRVHCITFGAPPVTLLPLQHPPGRNHYKSMFLAFANEGDPVVRADEAVLKSLLRLYAVPAPEKPCKVICPIVNAVAPGFVPPRIKKMKSRHQLHANPWPAEQSHVVWNVPSSTLSLGGRIILLRERFGGSGPDDMETCSVTDEMLREVIYGDPMAHAMTLYARRIELLATQAATAVIHG